MDRILSARVDDVIVNKISFLAQKLHLSKKKIIEGAVRMYAREMESTADMNVFTQTSGAWKRSETVEETVHHAKNSFRMSMERHHA